LVDVIVFCRRSLFIFVCHGSRSLEVNRTCEDYAASWHNKADVDGLL